MVYIAAHEMVGQLVQVQPFGYPFLHEDLLDIDLVQDEFVELYIPRC